MTETTAPPVEETFDWEALLPVVAAPAPTYATGSTIDVLTEIPTQIRRAAEFSLSETVKGQKEYAAKGANLKNFAPPWQLQRVTSPVMGEKFKALLTRYCKYRPEPANGKPGIEFQEFGTPNGQLTLRAGEPTKYLFDAEGRPVLFKDGMEGTPVLCVRFVVKPFERKDTKAIK